MGIASFDLTNGQIPEVKDGGVDRGEVWETDGRTDGRTDGQKDGQTDKKTKRQTGR